MAYQSTRYVFTLNNPVVEPAIEDMKAKYLIYGREHAATTGTYHLQGYVIFKTQQTLTAVRKLLPTAHWEQAKGTSEEASAYCKKTGDFYESGAFPSSKRKQGEDERERWVAAKTAAQAGKFDDVPADIYVRYYRTLKEIAKDHMTSPPDNSILQNEWYCGATGCGKSSKAKLENPGAFYKTCNKWWDGYQGEKVVIIEDFDQSHEKLGHHLKIWGDHGAFPAETKGGMLSIRPEKIIVTSNYSIDDIWPHSDGTSEPLHRRYKTTHFDIPFTYKGPELTLPDLTE